MAARRILPRLLIRVRRIVRNDQVILALLAIFVGVAAGLGAIAFRLIIAFVQEIAFGFSSERVYTLAKVLPWWQILLAPAAGGLLVGLLVHVAIPGRRPLGVPQVMAASALFGGRLTLRAGIAAALASATSIGVGASVGREGPVVHLGASLASWFGQRLHISAALMRTLLGCGVAAAVAASFNAPIAGVFFALEVVIGHHALSAFTPIVIASVTGTIVSRLYYGDFPAFILPQHSIVSFLEFPAFALLGGVSAVVAMIFMWSVFVTEDMVEKVGARLTLPRWTWPGVGGLLVGAIALAFPHVLGVGYEATDAALNQLLPLWLMLALIVAKTAATAISLGFGFGGGVFSPSLFLGAMTGGAFGIIATALLPELSSGHSTYTMVGMGAVAAAVLGAPISTILIIFEMTGDYAVTIAVMIGVVMASTLTTEVLGKSFFLWQLERKRINLKGGREIGLMSAIRVSDVMRRHFAAVALQARVEEITEALRTTPYGEVFVIDDAGLLFGVITITDLSAVAFGMERRAPALTAGDLARRNPPMLQASDDLREAMRLMDAAGESHLPVVDSRQSRRAVGFVHERDVMLAYHRALLEARAEERGERGRRRGR